MRINLLLTSAVTLLTLSGASPDVFAQTTKPAKRPQNPQAGKASGKIQRALWESLDATLLPNADNHPYLGKVNSFRAFAIDTPTLRATLKTAPMEFMAPVTESQAVITLPTPTGKMLRFRFVESPILSPELSLQNPDIKTYCGQCIEDPTISTRFDMTLTGFHAMVYSSNGNYYVNPYSDGNMEKAVVFYDSDIQRAASWKCLNAAQKMEAASESMGGKGGGFVITPQFTSGTVLRTYRLALSCTGEYAAAVCSPSAPTVPLTQSKMVTSINRVDGIFELETCIRLNLVTFNIYLDGLNDPFTNDDGYVMLNENQSVCDASPGSAKYDIGHVFSTGGGGIAQRPCVCISGSKAEGVTGSSEPFGDGFDVDYVIHEMGHQFGGDHTFNGTVGDCGGGNRTSNAAYEPGSGSTIMAYAGICGSDDLQPHSDPYFHAKNLEQIITYRNGGGACGSTNNTGNSVPTINVGTTYTIPLNTPFTMTAIGADANNDTLTYCWEQYNLGSTTASTNLSSGVLFRSFNPTTSSSRDFPRLPDLLSNVATPQEILPSVARSIQFRCTVRDNRIGGGGVQNGDIGITATGAAFSLTNRSTAFSAVSGSTYTVNWTVGSTGSTANVAILFSSSSVPSFTTLVASTPNTGSATVTLPNVATTTGRFMVRAVGNIFFDVSRVAGVLKAPLPVITSLLPNSAAGGGSAFTLTVNGSAFVSASKIRWNGGALATTFVSSTQLTTTVPMSYLASVGTATVTVLNPTTGGGGGVSNALTFTIFQSRTVAGTVLLEGLKVETGKAITLQFRPVGGGSNLDFTSTLNSGGLFSLGTVPAGNYNLAIKGTKWLQKVVPVDLTSGDASGLNVTLLTGDINGDNAVDFGDLSTLLQTYNALSGDPLYTLANDLNEDGGIDFGDLSLMLQNYNTLGDP